MKALKGIRRAVKKSAVDKDVFGRYGSGRSDLSVNCKAILKDKLRARHNRDRLRNV